MILEGKLQETHEKPSIQKPVQMTPGDRQKPIGSTDCKPTHARYVASLVADMWPGSYQPTLVHLSMPLASFAFLILRMAPQIAENMSM